MALNKNFEKYALINGVVADGIDLFLQDGAILIDHGKIERVGSTGEIEPLASQKIDVGGRLIIPGLTNAHHHLYSSLATGLVPVGGGSTFNEILENMWWRLDKILDEESVYLSALVGIVDSVKHGVTTIFDHHASMNFVAGSLDAIASAFELAGINGVLCFESSDRGDIDAHITENIRFFEKARSIDYLNGMFGLHANMTLSDDSLRKIAAAKPDDMPIHVHCGESKIDLEFCRDLGYDGPVQRLANFNLIDDKSILAHCIHLSDSDYRLIDEFSPVVASNPESNFNNRVGAIDRERIGDFVLGTDGMAGDMISAARFQFLHDSGSETIFEQLSRALFDNVNSLKRNFFPNSGLFESGSKADIAVLDYVPLTPIDADNLMAHLLFGTKTARAYYTISEGKIIVERGEINFIDERELQERVKPVARRLHERFYV